MEQYGMGRKEYKRKWMAAKRAKDRKRKRKLKEAPNKYDSSCDEEVPVTENNESPEPPVDAQVMYDRHNTLHSDSDGHTDLEACYDHEVKDADADYEWTWDMIDKHMALSSESKMS